MVVQRGLRWIKTHTLNDYAWNTLQYQKVLKVYVSQETAASCYLVSGITLVRLSDAYGVSFNPSHQLICTAHFQTSKGRAQEQTIFHLTWVYSHLASVSLV